MATQSMVMGDAFGRAFQYGKRKISAMTNEEFNATSLEQQASEMFASYKTIIGEDQLQKAMAESSELQRIIIKEMLAIIPQFIKDFGGELKENIEVVAGETADILDAGAHLLGAHIGHDTPTTPTGTPITETTTALINGHITFYVHASSQPSLDKVKQFFKLAYPLKVVFTSFNSQGGIQTKETVNGVYYVTRYTYLITYTSPFSLPKTLTATQADLAKLP